MANMSLKKVAMPEQDPNVRNKNFEEFALGYTKEMAMEEAARFLNCKNKPCVGGCPVNVPIPAFIDQFSSTCDTSRSTSDNCNFHSVLLDVNFCFFGVCQKIW